MAGALWYPIQVRDDLPFQRSPEVVSRVLDGEAVLLDLASGTYFGLNEVGTRVWELLEQPRTLAELRAALLEEFEVSEDVLAVDLEALLGTLETRHLARPTEE